MIPFVDDKADLDFRLEQAGNKLVVVDFFASWCGPCKMIAPNLETCAEEHPEIVILKVDVDENGDLAKEYDISLMPTIIFMKNKKVIKRFSGSNYEKVISTIKELK